MHRIVAILFFLINLLLHAALTPGQVDSSWTQFHQQKLINFQIENLPKLMGGGAVDDVVVILVVVAAAADDVVDGVGQIVEVNI